MCDTAAMRTTASECQAWGILGEVIPQQVEVMTPELGQRQQRAGKEATGAIKSHSRLWSRGGLHPKRSNFLVRFPGLLLLEVRGPREQAELLLQLAPGSCGPHRMY